MKKTIVLFLCLSQSLSVLAQAISPNVKRELMYSVQPAYERSVKKSVLTGVKRLREITPGYPVNWISGYESVQIVVESNGKTEKALGTDESLSEEQISLLKKADLSSLIIIDADYFYDNPVTKKRENNKIHMKFTVTPDEEAAYPQGMEKLVELIRNNTDSKVKAPLLKMQQRVKLRFTIKENGQVDNIQLMKTSGDKTIDKVIIETIQKMPEWKPAKNKNGEKVKQDFEIVVSGDAEGC